MEHGIRILRVENETTIQEWEDGKWVIKFTLVGDFDIELFPDE
jgi:hypothetical protein